MSFDRSVLVDESTERAVLAAVLLRPELLPTLDATLGHEAFYIDRHGAIWDAYRSLDQEGTPIDLRTVSARMAETHVGKAGEHLVYLSGLDLDLPDLGRVDSYARIVRRRAEERRLADACERALHVLSRGDQGDPATRAERLAQQLEAAAQGASMALSPQRPTDAGRVAEGVLEALMIREEREGVDRMPGLSTMWPDWDKRTGGLCGGELIVLAGLPGMGKSTALTNLALHVGKARPVVLVSLEMSEREIGARMLANLGRVPQTPLRMANLDAEQWGSLFDARAALRTRRISLICDEVDSSERIIASVRKLATQADGIGLVGIDYLQLMRSAGRFATRNLELSHITRSLKRLAVEVDVPVVLLSQLSREAVRSGGRPKAHHLRDSGAIEQDADMIVFLHDDNPPDEGTPIPDARALVAIVEKHRGGDAGYSVPIIFERTTGRMLPRAPRWRAA